MCIFLLKTSFGDKGLSIFLREVFSKHSIIDNKKGVIQMKKFQHSFTFILVLSAILFISTSVSAALVFTDLERVEWAKDEIYYLSENGIINGYGNGQFGPSDKITREQAALMLVKAIYPNEVATQAPDLKDVSPGQFYYPAIALAKEKGLINGYNDGTFKGKHYITRAEIAVMIDEAYDVNRGDTSVRFSDVPNKWYTASILDLASNRIITGYENGTFQPDKHVTRAEFSVILAYAMEPSFRPIVTVPEPKPEEDIQQFVAEVIRLTNQERQQHGLAPLAEDKDLSQVAQLKSEDMQLKDYFDHLSPTYGSPFEMMDRFGVSYRAAGENIAYGYRTPEDVVEGWMNSPGHRANILQPAFTHIGIGFEPQGFYWTQMFIGK